jgi:hypothetical protein
MRVPTYHRDTPRSFHFKRRQAERQLRPDVLEFILAFGTEVQACGATHLTIVRRRLPVSLRNGTLARRAEGWVVLLDDEGRLMTCYRRQDAVRYLRRKPKRRPSPRWSQAG